MLEYQTLYRKYRPQTFEEVVGQETVLSHLKKVVSEQKPAHAYLFSGGRGTGKTSLARIFAKSLGVKQEDIYELDAASNRGIDEVRALRESVHTLPLLSPYKVYILDEAHMLTKEAANALLKTLEEPPSHVIFILATTERHKLPETIHSRCQTVLFSQPGIDELSSYLSSVAGKEGYTLPKESALLVAKEARGSYRDALGHLEKLLRVTDSKEISLLTAKKVFGVTGDDLVEEITMALLKEEYEALYGLLKTAESRSVDPGLLFEAIVELLRELVLVRVGAKADPNGHLRAMVLTISNEKQFAVQSKHIIYLLEKSHLLGQSDERSWQILPLLLLEMRSL